MNPTTYPYGNNQVASTGVLFEDRKLYKEYFIEQVKLIEDYGSKIPFADLYLDNSLYGMINLNADLIQLKNPQQDLKSVVGFNNETFKLLNFVADAYSGLKEYLNKAFILGKLPADSYLTRFQLYRAYINPNAVDSVIKQKFRNAFKQEYIQDHELNASIEDHKTFVNIFNNYLTKNIGSYPVTKGSSLLTSNFLGFSSGLIFDIADVAADDDLKKYLQFLTTKEFLIFAEGCLRFGFKIDSNVPWRLVADLNSRALMPYYKKYNIKNINDVFGKYFKSTYVDELENIKKFYLETYNYYVRDNEYYHKSLSKTCADDSNKRILLKRDPVGEERFFKDFNDAYWIRIYTFFKNLEFQRGLTQTEFDNIVREAADYCKLGRQERSLKYINDFFKNYSNVLYYRKEIKVEEEKLDDVTNYLRPAIKL